MLRARLVAARILIEYRAEQTISLLLLLSTANVNGIKNVVHIVNCAVCLQSQIVQWIAGN